MRELGTIDTVEVGVAGGWVHGSGVAVVNKGICRVVNKGICRGERGEREKAVKSATVTDTDCNGQ
jgi:hypothetical protein